MSPRLGRPLCRQRIGSSPTTAALPSTVGEGPVPLAAIFFLQYRPEIAAPVIEPLGKAEAAARLFANALNPLAHVGDGLDGAIKVCTRVAAVKLFSADLMVTCALIRATWNTLPRMRPSRGTSKDNGPNDDWPPAGCS